ncbi:hypothetical protein UFOVP244_23 [uncultured Caudovirales phage]|uniref:Uncharacterized protein n=1 Tax=uncultured Caudovirales phage TaxID=2100421 RepID=A0A6J7X0C4_9CAUD|nr:hypothetical protein UFOVP244_23 [uncultured Caudovirales phage]
MSRPPINDQNSNQGLLGLGSIPGLAPVAAFNVDQVESLLRTKGIKALHYKSALNPDRESIEMGVNVNTKAAQHGVVYYEVRELLVVPQSMNINSTLQIQGMYDNMSATVLNVTGNYTDGDKGAVYIKPRDLIVLNETISVMAEQLLEYNPTKPLKTKFKVKGVDALFTNDARFRDGIDFEVRQDGLVHWLQGRRPKYANGKGQVVSLSYWMAPHFLINNSPHILRLLPSNDTGNGALPRRLVYAPQQVIAVQSHLTEVADYLDFFSLPTYDASAL